MAAVRTGTRLDALRALLKQTDQEISCAIRRDADVARLRVLQTHLRDEIAAEEAGSGRVLDIDPQMRRLADLGITSHDVKVWAYGQGLVDAVKRGRVSDQLVDAYVACNAARAATLAEHGRGPCGECGEPMIYAPTWQAASAETLTRWKAWGFARVAGRGYCTRCYARLKSQGRIDRRWVRVAAGDQVCARCGMPDVATNEEGFCADCEDVLSLEGQVPA